MRRNLHLPGRKLDPLRDAGLDPRRDPLFFVAFAPFAFLGLHLLKMLHASPVACRSSACPPCPEHQRSARGRKLGEVGSGARLEHSRCARAVSRSSAARGSAGRSAIAASSASPPGFGSRSVTVFAICSGVGRRATGRGLDERERRLAFVRVSSRRGSSRAPA
jgi:hypothetical protein